MKKLFLAFLILPALFINISYSEPAIQKPVKINAPGLDNFYKISDDLYRGAMPTMEGFQELKKMGVKTVITLQTFHADKSSAGKKVPDLQFVNIRMQAWRTEDKDTIQFIKIMKDKKNLPAVVHCYHGSDRTGMMSAVYRIFFQGWSREKAIDEMKNGGFGFHKEFENLAGYLKKMDIEKIKKESGL